MAYNTLNQNFWVFANTYLCRLVLRDYVLYKCIYLIIYSHWRILLHSHQVQQTWLNFLVTILTTRSFTNLPILNIIPISFFSFLSNNKLLWSLLKASSIFISSYFLPQLLTLFFNLEISITMLEVLITFYFFTRSL